MRKLEAHLHPELRKRPFWFDRSHYAEGVEVTVAEKDEGAGKLLEPNYGYYCIYFAIIVHVMDMEVSNG